MRIFVRVDLQKELNHKIIGDKEVLEENKGMTNLGISGYPEPELFLPGGLPGSLEKVSVDGVAYTFPDKAKGSYDNIACREQRIKVPQGSYGRAYFMGCSEWGSFKEKIILHFADGSEEDGEIFLHDWTIGDKGWSFEGEKNCKVAFRALNSLGMTKYLYYSTIEIAEQKELEAIQLPYNNSVHIIAITLEKR